MATPRIIVTRPEPEARFWVDQLARNGLPAVALPLIAIGPCTAPAAKAALTAAHKQWQHHHWKAAMFVSSNAVRHFFGINNGLPLEYIDFNAIKTRVWTPGPSTALAAQQLGIPQTHIDSPANHAEQFDSEHLWQQVRHQVQPGDAVLIVRGDSRDSTTNPNAASAAKATDTQGTNTQGTGREWLHTQIIARGASVSTVATYQRQPADWTSEQMAMACQATHDGSIWLLSSSEALHWLAQRLPNVDWAYTKALVTHPRIAATAQAMGIKQVQICRPALADVIASIESTV